MPPLSSQTILKLSMRWPRSRSSRSSRVRTGGVPSGKVSSHALSQSVARVHAADAQRQRRPERLAQALAQLPQALHVPLVDAALAVGRHVEVEARVRPTLVRYVWKRRSRLCGSSFSCQNQPGRMDMSNSQGQKASPLE